MHGPEVALRRVKIKRYSHLQIEWSYSNLTIRRKILEPSMAEIGGICPPRDRKIGKRVGPCLRICDRTPWEKLISIHTDPVTLTGGQQVSPLFSRYNEKSFSWTLKLNFDIFIMFTPKIEQGTNFRQTWSISKNWHYLTVTSDQPVATCGRKRISNGVEMCLRKS